jgi:hypothetical protein
VSIEVRGAEALAGLSRMLRQAGARDLQRELGRAVNNAVKPVKAEIKASALHTLPHTGGLAARAARSKLATRRRTGRVAGVRVVSTDRTLSTWHLNQGIIRHRKNGRLVASQHTRPGYFDRATEATADEARRELTRAMVDIAKRIDRA